MLPMLIVCYYAAYARSYLNHILDVGMWSYVSIHKTHSDIFLDTRWLRICHRTGDILKYKCVNLFDSGFSYCQSAAPERSKQVLDPSSPTRPDSVRVLNRVPMGSRGCPTQPSMLVMEVWPLWSNSEQDRAEKSKVKKTTGMVKNFT